MQGQQAASHNGKSTLFLEGPPSPGLRKDLCFLPQILFLFLPQPHAPEPGKWVSSRWGTIPQRELTADTAALPWVCDRMPMRSSGSP